jgi:hypothetical protein
MLMVQCVHTYTVIDDLKARDAKRDEHSSGKQTGWLKHL